MCAFECIWILSSVEKQVVGGELHPETSWSWSREIGCTATLSIKIRFLSAQPGAPDSFRALRSFDNMSLFENMKDYVGHMLGTVMEYWEPSWRVGNRHGVLGTVMECWEPSWRVGNRHGVLRTVMECWELSWSVGNRHGVLWTVMEYCEQCLQHIV